MCYSSLIWVDAGTWFELQQKEKEMVPVQAERKGRLVMAVLNKLSGFSYNISGGRVTMHMYKGLMVHATYYGIENDKLGNKDGADVEDNDIGIGSTFAVYKISGSGYNEVESTAAEVYVNGVK
ncbi:hypothetical protein C5167_006753 [Papaver somniferum]|uniref:Uncharacterized protein n=1 Tax=Papaver somniferum TaxID=3469 RepID=A0A4Y7JE43_PAPSO|nr:hypothetical protein C5167_006753 [Papaver somniferum]